MCINQLIKNISFRAIVAAVMILSANVAKAQPRMRMSLDDRMKSLTEQLTLTKVQADSIRIIYLQSDSIRAKMFQIRQGGREGMRDAMQKMQDSTDAKIERLLTKEQKEKYLKIKQERRQRREMPPPPPQDNPSPDAPPPNLE